MAVEDGPQLDLEALAAKRSAGGGMLDSVANMANSILGAGKWTVSYMKLYSHDSGQESSVNCLCCNYRLSLTCFSRLTVRCTTGGVFHGISAPCGSVRCDGLDYPSYRHQREAQRSQLVH